MSLPPLANPLVGCWRLVSWENRDAAGQVEYPLGPDARGSLLYTAEGRFAVLLARADREPFIEHDLLAGSVAEKARAVEGFVAYAGRYTFGGDHVMHHVELSLFPNWTGTDQRREVQLTGNRLTLSVGPLVVGGKPQTASLVWERVASLR